MASPSSNAFIILMTAGMLASLAASVFAAPPANDNCVNAIPVGNGLVTPYPFTIDATSDGTTTCNAVGLSDVWYRYTAPANGIVSFSTCHPLATTNTVLSLHSGCPGTAANTLSCSDDTCGMQSRIVRAVASGQVIYIRVATYGQTSVSLNIIPNETCNQSIPIGYGITLGNTIGAVSDGASGCGIADASPDVWYSFTAPASGPVEFTTCAFATDYDTLLSVHSACPGSAANSLGCNDDACDSNSRVQLNVVQGSTYYIRVTGYNGAAGAFRLEVNPVTVPTNDVCTGFVRDLDEYGSITGRTIGATTDGTTTCGNSNASPDVWYRFIAPETRNVKFSLCGSKFIWNSVLSLHSTCPSGGANTLVCNDDSCGNLSELSYNVVQGTTYYVRIAGNGAASGEFKFSVFPNETCATALPIGYGSFKGTTVGAKPEGDSVCGFDDDSADVWFAFTAPATTAVSFSTCNDGGSQVLSVHTACPGTPANELICNYNGCGTGRPRLLLNVAQGQTYYVRVADNYTDTSDDFTLVVAPRPANDHCGSPTDIGYGTFAGSTSGATLDSDTTCWPTANSGSDVWYRFTAPETRIVNFSTTTMFSGLLSIHSGCLGTVANTIACDSSNFSPSLTLGVQQGQQYLIRVGGKYGFNGSFSLTVGPFVLENDNCADAQAIDIGSTSGSNVGATSDGTSCFAPSADVWYRYTSPSDGIVSLDTCQPSFDTVLSVHTACPATALNQLACSSSSPDCGIGSRATFPAVKDATYYIRVAGLFGGTGTFTLTLTPPPPTNDACADARNIVFGYHAATNVGTTTDGSASCGLGTNDVWFRIIPPATGPVYFSVCDAAFDSLLSIHTECDGTPENTVACNDNGCLGTGSRIQTTLNQGQTYLIRVASLTGTGGFTLRAFPAVTNDECVSAILVSAGSYQGTNEGATPGTATGCLDNQGNDVWYRYVAPGTGPVVFDTCATAVFDSVISVHPDCPPAPANLIACNDDACNNLSSRVEVEVVEGSTYYVRVGGLSSGAFGTFTLTVSDSFYNGRQYGDFNNSGCVDLTDFLILLDNWTLPYNGIEVGLTDFLNLLDNWQLCPGV